jgi:cyclopropane-fatty-acyl-phospholipid synthase
MSPAERAARRLVLALASRLRTGSLTVVESGARTTFGAGAPAAEVVVHHPRAYRALLASGSSGLGTSYTDGDWDTPDLLALLTLLGANLEGLDRLRDRLHGAAAPLADPVRRRRRPDPGRDRRNVSAHYDLGDDFFATFLDPTLTYSCAFFDEPGRDLETAQQAKLERICGKLGLGPGDHVLEIGTGWGSFAIHAASTHGCRVTTTTISRRQLATARARVAAAGLEDLVDVRGDHYRDLDGRYDAIVSIEMIEAVDWREHGAYFARCAQLLRPGGRMGLQAIVIDDARYARARVSADFIKRHVFPGGCLPSLSSIVSTASASGALRVRHVEDLTPHYVRTLGCWRDRLDAAEVPDERRRLWRFYLDYCAAGFDLDRIGVVQVVLT